MALITSNVPNLVNGVSQQADGLRFASQADELVNGYCSLVDGLVKRPPSLHVAKVSKPGLSPTAFSDLTYVHTINRDSTERYTALVDTDGIPRVYNMNGVAQSVTVLNNAATYLASSNPKRDLKFLTVADNTFVLNKSKTTAVLKDAATEAHFTPTRSKEAMVFIAQGDYQTTYKLKVNGAVGSYTSVAGTATDASLKVQPAYIAEQLANSLLLPGRVTTINVTFGGQYSLIGAGTAPTVVITPANGGPGTGATAYAVMRTTGWLNASHRTVSEIIVTNGGTGYLLPPVITFTGGPAFYSNAGYAATATAAVASNETTTYSKKVIGSTIYLAPLSGITTFDVSVEDSTGGSAIKLVKDEVQHFADLPVEADDGFVVKVIGEPTEEGDEYYVKFSMDALVGLTAAERAGRNTGGSGTWSECVAPSLPFMFDPATLPHLLVREANGTFTLKQADYEDRNAGDEDTNPEPSFVGRKLNDIFFFKNRLGFTSDENIIFSEASEYFNFWRSSVVLLLDGDPIDVGTSSTKVSTLFAAVPFYDRLVLFADQTQFSLQTTALLTSKTVSIQQSTAFSAYTGCSPIASGRNIYFPFSRNSFAGLQESFINESNLLFDSADVTAGVPKYIAGNITKLTAADNEQLLVALSDGFPTGLYFYKFFFNANEKIQSAWFKADFGAGVKVLNADFIESALYVTLKRGNDVFIEKLNMESGSKDTNSQYTTLLDRRLLLTDAFYDAATGLTVFSTAYSLSGLSGFTLVSAKHPSYVSGVPSTPIGAQGLGPQVLPEGVVLPFTVSSHLSGLVLAFGATVTNKVLTANVATLTLSANPSTFGIVAGAVVMVAGVDATFNGTYTVLGSPNAPTSTTFSYAKTAANVASTPVTPSGLAGLQSSAYLQNLSSIVVVGDYTAQPVFFGLPYTMSYVVSRPVLRSPGASGRGLVQVTSGRYQLRRGTVSYDDSRFFKVEVEHKSGQTYSYVYNGRQLGCESTVLGSNSSSIQDGLFKFPINSKNDNVTIRLLNDSPFPCRLISLDFEGNYHARSQRFN